MIKTVTVTNYIGESIVLDLRRPESNGLIVAKIEGLGPSKATINISETSTTDGGLFNSARLEIRNIVLTLGFDFGTSIEEIRHKTYKYFPIKKKVKLKFETDVRTIEIIGYVEHNEPEVFSMQQSTQISILCPDPNFYAEYRDETLFSGVVSGFEFPFSNESLTEDLLELGIIRIEKEQTVFYEGDLNVGVQIHIHALGPVQGLTIHNVQTREKMVLDHDKIVKITGSGIQARDDIIISTETSDKYITLYRDGEYYNILNCLGRSTDWFKLVKGDNIFVYEADVGADELQFRITNQIAYEGV